MSFPTFSNVSFYPNLPQANTNIGHGSSGSAEHSFHNNQVGLGQVGSNSSTAVNQYTPSPHFSFPDPDNTSRILSLATGQMLLGSGNAAFFELFQDKIRLELELQIEKKRLESLLSSAPPTSITPFAIPSASSSATATTSSGLAIPHPPPALDRDDYVNADECWWEKELWVSHINREKSKGRLAKKLGFLTDALGVPVSKERLAIISRAARTHWVTLYRFRHDPEHWGSKSKEATDYFSNSMRLQFPEFQLCDGDWKIEAFATLRYPDWKINRDVDTLKRDNPSINPSLKRKNPPTDIKGKKTKKASTITPIDVDAIDPDSDVQIVVTDNTRNSSTSTLTPTPAPAPTPTLSSTSCTLGRKTSTPETPLPMSISGPTAPTAPQPAPPSTPLLPTPPTSSSLPPSPQAHQEPATPDKASLLPGPSVSSEKLVDVAQTRTPVPPAPSILEPVSSPLAGTTEPAVQPAPTESASGVQRRGRPRRQGANALQNLSIPKPPASVVALVTNSTATTRSQATPATATASTSATSKGRGKKGDTLLKDNGTTSARNLYAIDYLAKHGETSADAYKLIWDNLPAETVKEYKLKSAAAKKKY